jgi:hypothetical protein
MTDRATQALAADDGFERRGDRFVATHTTFDATADADGDGCRLELALPTLDAAVEGETVADVVEDGWFETFERRLDGVDAVTRTATVEPPTVERTDDSVVVETRLADAGDDAAEDARAVVNYVEGTWFEGVVPGYDYVETVEAVRKQAHQQGSTGGTPP